MTKIVAIEDEKTILNNILEILDIGGYEGYGALSGQQGIELVRQHHPDLILCDINMPGMDGYTVLMTLRSDPAVSQIPLLFLTAYVDRDFQRKGMNLGAEDYLTKPFTPNELLEMLRVQLEKAEERRKIRDEEFDALRNNIMLALPHELRTPLTGIITCADILLLDFEEQTTELPRIEQMVKIMHDAGLRLQRLIENYLVFAQIELYSRDEKRKALLVRGEGVDTPTAIIQDALTLVPSIGEREADITVELEDANVKVSVGNLTKIVIELVDNAFKFSEEETPVSVKAARNGSTYQIAIRDRGRGMTHDQIQHIGVYMQFDRHLYEQQGLGLGLMLARRMAELHGGEIQIESVPKQGTTVTVSLPLMPAG